MEFGAHAAQKAWLKTGAYVLIGGALVAGGYATRDNNGGRAIAVTATAIAIARLFEAPLFGGGDAIGAAYTRALRSILLVLGGVTGVAIGVLGTQEEGTRAAFSIAGGAAFTLLSITEAWSF